MKYFHSLMTGLAILAALTLSACGDDEPEENYHSIVYKTEEIEIDPANPHEPTITFQATDTWTLSSDQMWCTLKQGDKNSTSLTGSAGEQTVAIVVDTEKATGEAQKATISLNTGNTTQTLAEVTLKAISYRGQIMLGDLTYTSDKTSADNHLYVFEYPGKVSIQANFDFNLIMPEWCLVDNKNSFSGKANERYEVQFSFDDTKADSRYRIEGELVFEGTTMRDVFHIAYLGLDKYAIDIELQKAPGGATLSKWGWIIDTEAQTYSQTAHDNTVELKGGINFTVTCRDDKVQFVYVTHNNGEYSFNTATDYATVEGANGEYRFTLKGGDKTPDSGELMAFAEAAWDTIKTNPVAALMERDEERGIDVFTPVSVNNVVLEWSKYKPSDCPITVHHTMLYNEDWSDFKYYDLKPSSDYRNIFGSEDVWEMQIDPSDVRLCIELKGYDTQWFGSMRIGFDYKMNMPLDEIAEPGSCAWKKPEQPVFYIYMSKDQCEQLSRGPLYVAIANTDNGTVTCLVIKALQ